jgi:hypothetical protein
MSRDESKVDQNGRDLSMLFRQSCAGAALIALGLIAMTSVARADRIDGHWCAQDGRYVFIRGPEIVTPGNNRVAGNYSRHNFSYVVPANEPAAGQTVTMDLLGEYLMHSYVGSRSTETKPDVWNRCAARVS